MDAALLQSLLGGDRNWSSPCVVLLDCEAAVKTAGPDHIGGGGMKTYAPRYSTGRIEADTCCLLSQEHALAVLQQVAYRDSTGMDQVKRTLLVVDLKYVVGLEFTHLNVLNRLQLPTPVISDDQYRPGALVG